MSVRKQLGIMLSLSLLMSAIAVSLPAYAAEYYEVESVNVPSTGTVNQPVQVQARITNTGDAYGHQSVFIVIENSKGLDEFAKAINVNLNPAESVDITEPLTFEEAGQFKVRVVTNDDEVIADIAIEGENNNEEAQLLMGSAYVDPFSLTSRISAIMTDGTLLYLELKGDISGIERNPSGSSHPTVGSSMLTGSQTQMLLDLAKDLGVEIDPRYEIYWGGVDGLTGSERGEVRDVIVTNDFPNLQSQYHKTAMASDRGKMCMRAEKPEGGVKTVCELGFGAAPSAYDRTARDGMDHFINSKFGAYQRPAKTVFGTSSIPAASSVHTVSAKPQTHDGSHHVQDVHADDFTFTSQNAAKDDPNHTSEFLMGSVTVSIVLLESDGSVDDSTEDWDTARADKVASEIQDALDFWEGADARANLSFTIKNNNATGKPYTIVETGFEPINRSVEDEFLWIDEAMAELGYNQGGFVAVREYNHDLRQEAGTDWAYTIFVADSFNDDDGQFAPGTFARTFFAYAYIGGPFLVMTYDNGDWGIERMNQVAAHETGHVFYATDEYVVPEEVSGYLNGEEVDFSGLLMDRNTLNLSEGTLQQIGWVDSDNDGIFDVLDTNPDTEVTDVQNDGTITIKGTASVQPFNNQNPRNLIEGTQPTDLTINTIAAVEFSVDGGDFQSATADDGAFDEAEEAFTIELDLTGNHTVEVRAVNSVGNADTSPATVNTDGSSSSQPDPDPTPPPSSSSSIEKALDGNNNGVLDDAEIQAAIGFWILGQEVPGTDETIDDNKIKSLIQIWITGGSVASVSSQASFVPMQLEQTQVSVQGQTLSVIAAGKGIERVELELFDLGGQRLAKASSLGNRLNVDLLSTNHQRLPNGVYLTAITAYGSGTSPQRQIRKIVILN